MIGIGKADTVLVMAGRGEQGERLRVGHRGGPGQQDGGLLPRGDAVPQARGQHLLQLRQDTDRSLGDPGDPADGGGA